MAVALALGSYRQAVSLALPTITGDGDGGYTETPAVPLNPAVWRCSIDRSNVRDAEQFFASTIVSASSHIMRGRYHSGITTKTVVTWTDRGGTVHTGNVVDVVDPEGAGVETVILVSELPVP